MEKRISSDGILHSVIITYYYVENKDFFFAFFEYRARDNRASRKIRRSKSRNIPFFSSFFMRRKILLSPSRRENHEIYQEKLENATIGRRNSIGKKKKKKRKEIIVK